MKPAGTGFRTRITTYIILRMNACVLVRCPLGAPLVLAVVLAAAPGDAQEKATDPSAATGGLALPEPPATAARNDEGEITIRAVRLEEPLELDGALDEAVYGRIEPASGFIQQNPDNGAPATEDTQLWVFYDDRNVYVALRALDSRPERIVANEMRRDNRNIWLNDNVIVTLDTFLDRRSAFFFETNPLGGVRDALILDENTTNYDWNTVWDVRSRRVEEGWTTEMAIPFESLRYAPGREQVWGINVNRVVRAKNEFTLLSPVPRSFNRNGIFRLASAATLVGLEAPSASHDLEFRPYAISTLRTDRTTGVSRDLDADGGLDASYGITNSMTLDLTYNTDFAQVEIDEQQVNLSRFSLLFPEKRDFLLEGQGVFDFVGIPGGGPNRGGPDPTPILFYSRRIGFASGGPVPIEGGGRLMGRAGPVSTGVLNMQTDGGEGAGAPGTNFTVARVKSDVFERGRIGALATYRRPSGDGDGSNLAWGADFDLSPVQELWLTGYYARTRGPAEASDGESYLAQARYDADRYGLRLERLKVDEGFDPGVGLLRRSGFLRSYVQGRISRRPESLPLVRRVSLEAGLDHYVNESDVLETQQEQARLDVEFHSGDRLLVDYSRQFEFLQDPFAVAGGRLVAPGSYRFHEVSARFEAGSHRWVSGNVNASHGSFYTGRRTQLGYNGRVKFGPRFSVEPRISLDWVTLEDESFRVTLLGARPTLTLTPRNFLSALVQYNSSTEAVETNVRWRWELQPGTILYVVYTDARDTGGVADAGNQRSRDEFTGVLNRSFAVKFTRLVRF